MKNDNIIKNNDVLKEERSNMNLLRYSMHFT
jgi:hypothetical protein